MDEENKKIESLCKAVAEMAYNCEHDLTGEHRENYNTRIMDAYIALTGLYPLKMARAIIASKFFK